MPNKHFYFAMGAANGAIIVCIVRQSRRWLYNRFKMVRRLYRLDRDWFLYFPLFIGLMGVVALTPDIFHALHLLPKDVTRGEFFNIFYFHSYFEWLEDESLAANQAMNTLGSVFLLLLSVGMLMFYVREIKKIIRKSCQK